MFGISEEYQNYIPYFSVGLLVILALSILYFNYYSRKTTLDYSDTTPISQENDNEIEKEREIVDEQNYNENSSYQEQTVEEEIIKEKCVMGKCPI
jgi:ABC-type uncharacterized transport system involved in gliding motility auxiliary subunit